MPYAKYDEPVHPVEDSMSGYRGISHRDYFAAQALTGLDLKNRAPERVAEAAYAIADAMMRIR